MQNYKFQATAQDIKRGDLTYIRKVLEHHTYALQEQAQVNQFVTTLDGVYDQNRLVKEFVLWVAKAA